MKGCSVEDKVLDFSPTFCSLPFNHCFVGPAGEKKPCSRFLRPLINYDDYAKKMIVHPLRNEVNLNRTPEEVRLKIMELCGAVIAKTSAVGAGSDKYTSDVLPLIQSYETADFSDTPLDRIEGEMKISELLAKQDQTIAKINPELDTQQKAKEVIAIQEKTNADIAEVNAQTQRKIAKIISDDQLKALREQEQFYKRIGEVISSGIVDGIQSAIDGSKSLGESLSGILKQLGGMFLKAGIGSVGTDGQPGTGLIGALGFASGGFVSGATPAVVGEAGPEYIIPESKMRSAMSRYSRGARGAAVIPEGGDGGTSGEGGGTAVAAPIDVRFNVERINNVDYVTAEQFQAGLQQAAQQGAAEGERRAMGSLRNSAAVRRRIGV